MMLDHEVTLYGPGWSAYVRTARLILIEKGVRYKLTEVDFANGDMPQEQISRHPFGKVPALSHGDFQLYETAAIGRYIDSKFTGPPLQPSDPQTLAKMAQIIAIFDHYLSTEIRMGYVYERLFKPMLHMPIDEARALDAGEKIVSGFAALADIVDAQPCLVGDHISLADCHAIPLFDYLSMSPGGDQIIASQTALDRWWQSIRKRQSVLDTQYDLSIFR